MAPPIGAARAWQSIEDFRATSQTRQLDPIDDGACSAYPFNQSERRRIPCTSTSGRLRGFRPSCTLARRLAGRRVAHPGVDAGSAEPGACSLRRDDRPDGRSRPVHRQRGHARRRHRASRVRAPRELPARRRRAPTRPRLRACTSRARRRNTPPWGAFIRGPTARSIASIRRFTRQRPEARSSLRAAALSGAATLVQADRVVLRDG